MGFSMPYSLVSVALGLLGLLSAYFVYLKVKSSPEGDGRVKEIGDEIHLGAMVFMSAEYKRLAIFCLVCIAALYYSLGWQTAVSFLLGALCSGTAGFIGMYSATKANVRTAVAARDQGSSEALNIAFFGGSIMGLTVAAMGLFGVGILFYFFAGNIDTIHAIEGFAMGASSVALFSRVGGGIFTKSADVGADLVGKVEAGIPEDDPRNPGVIADNVGDNVGDVAGMGSDILESYCGSMIASIAIASTLGIAALAGLTPGITDEAEARAALMGLPLLLASAGLICSLVGIVLVRLMSDREPATALRFGTIGAPILFIGVSYFVITGTG